MTCYFSFNYENRKFIPYDFSKVRTVDIYDKVSSLSPLIPPSKFKECALELLDLFTCSDTKEKGKDYIGGDYHIKNGESIQFVLGVFIKALIKKHRQWGTDSEDSENKFIAILTKYATLEAVEN